MSTTRKRKPLKSCKGRVTLLCCSNATSSDRLQLLFVKKSKRTQSIIAVQKLPVVYDYQPKAWMAGDLFSRCPAAMMRYLFLTLKYTSRRQKKSGKMLLIIDNAPCHLSSELIDRENGLLKVVFPLNILSLVQPIYQTVINKYRKELLRRTVLSNLVRNTNLKHCCYMIAQAGNSISGSTLRVSRNKILGYNEECVIQSTDCT
ncbi:Jerky -like protein-like [Trichinella zimbabwensis]|uniref:Jerky-like protein-like n=1 Tax=Trichinella zimbabwensis TaxID=268475 RepID=A0A0V1GWP9_9BILA|nr:Jerky -like protein-like [Trichinella zimbabwensis]